MTLVQTALKEIHYGGPKLSNDTQGPCPDGFHVPLTSEWASLCSILTSTFGLASNASTMNTYLKMPNAHLRYYFNGDVQTADRGYYWSSSAHYGLAFAASWILPQWHGDSAYYSYKNQGLSIRAFKDTPVVPDSNWTTIYQGSGSAGIFHNATLGLISVSGDGASWTTIQDKNLGATAVYNSGDTLSEANCGKFYQWGNNYGFAWSGDVSKTTTKVDASGYGPGNYYSGSTFIYSGTDWSSVTNDNLRGGVSQGTQDKSKVKAVYLGTNKVRPPKIVLDFQNKGLYGGTLTGTLGYYGYTDGQGIYVSRRSAAESSASYTPPSLYDGHDLKKITLWYTRPSNSGNGGPRCGFDIGGNYIYYQGRASNRYSYLQIGGSYYTVGEIYGDIKLEIGISSGKLVCSINDVVKLGEEWGISAQGFTNSRKNGSFSISLGMLNMAGLEGTMYLRKLEIETG